MKILSCLVELGTVPTIAHGWYIPLSFTGGKNARAPESNHPPRALCTHVESFPPPWSSAEFFLMGSSCYTCPQPDLFMTTYSHHPLLSQIFSWCDGHINRSQGVKRGLHISSALSLAEVIYSLLNFSLCSSCF